MKRSEIKHLLNEDDFKLYNQLSKGKSQSEIAKLQGVSRQAIFCKVERLRNLGIPLPKDNRKSPINSIPWTHSEDKQLINSIKAGLCLEAISGLIGRSQDSIACRRQALVHKGELPRVRFNWTEKENNILIACYEERLTNYQISRIVERSASAVASQISFLKSQDRLLSSKVDNRLSMFFKAVSMRLEGYSNVEISKEFGKSDVYVSQLFCEFRKNGYSVPISPRYYGVPDHQKYDR